jgi:hypothetical protein
MTKTLFPGQPERGREQGGILITAILVIVVMLILAIPFLFKLSAGYRSTERGAKSLAAFNLAEAGVDKVVWSINMDWTDPYDPAGDPERINWASDGTSGTIDNIQTADNQASGNVAFILGADPDPGGMTPGAVRPLESTGRVSFIGDVPVERTVRVTLERYFGSIFDYGFVVDEYFRINNTQLTVDSYDSRVANYDPRNPGDLGFFAINSDAPNSFIVDQGGGGTIDVTGAIAAGGDDAVDLDPSLPTDELADTIVDLPKQIDEDVSQVAMDYPFTFPPVDLLTLHPKETWPDPQDISGWFVGGSGYADGTVLPEWAQVNTGFKGSSPGTGKTFDASNPLTTASNGVYTSFVVPDGTTLRVAANNDVVIMVSGFADDADVAHFVMGQGSRIVIEDGATLTLILGRTSFFMGNQSSINVPIVGETGEIALGDDPGTPGDCIILGMQDFASNYVGDLTHKDGLDIQKDPLVSPVGAMVFEQQVDISAGIYTPLARAFDIQGMNHADIYGAWIADSMIYKVAAGFHYDQALGDIMLIKGGPPKWRIVNWQEKVGN